MIPEFDYESHGMEDAYGAGDTHIACASVSFSTLLAELITYKTKDEK